MPEQNQRHRSPATRSAQPPPGTRGTQPQSGDQPLRDAQPRRSDQPVVPGAQMLRRTRQREAIHTALAEAMRPLSFEELLERARRHYPKVGERTLFRNVRELLDEQALVRIYLPGQPARYELPTWSHRPRLICRKSGKVFILPENAPDIIPLMPSLKDFVLEGEEVIFYGYHKNPPQD